MPYQNHMLDHQTETSIHSILMVRVTSINVVQNAYTLLDWHRMSICIPLKSYSKRVPKMETIEHLFLARSTNFSDDPYRSLPDVCMGRWGRRVGYTGYSIGMIEVNCKHIIYVNYSRGGFQKCISKCQQAPALYETENVPQGLGDLVPPTVKSRKFRGVTWQCVSADDEPFAVESVHVYVDQILRRPVPFPSPAEHQIPFHLVLLFHIMFAGMFDRLLPSLLCTIACFNKAPPTRVFSIGSAYCCYLTQKMQKSYLVNPDTSVPKISVRIVRHSELPILRAY